MKNILTPIVALFLSLQLHAAVKIVKFVDANGKEPQEQEYDQHCCLVNCADNTVIPDNNIRLAVGDKLVIETPKTHGFYSYIKAYDYTINNGTMADIEKLSTLQAKDPESDLNQFADFHFDIVASGVDSFDISFADGIFQAPGCYTRNHLLGHVTVTVVE
ncbi:MAG: hypothetical protein K2W97_08155 [Chthoniobacterales bacterium]|nr:hypothetical protein [Chthoniobacterales bacterium]